MRTRDDPRVLGLVQRLDEAEPADRATLRAELTDARAAVHSEKLGELAAEFDRIHSVERALEVGSMDRIIPARDLRRYLVEAVERGIDARRSASDAVRFGWRAGRTTCRAATSGSRPKSRRCRRV